ncbi:MAG: response regulator [Desulfobacterales bacterium]|nr:response regulator [Desulfobacterales bacterium]MDD4070981.1 response regulator [Desulfobacterales bacterium]MDD4391894.1 response regulator [Desulfobacterales bacterium]
MNKILIIDDETPTLTMFRFLLSAYGYTVLTAENGEAGIALFEQERPPLVLTDIKMPGMDGIEVLKRIKKIEPKTEVIVITGHGDMDLAIKALNLDATDFINKPIQRQALNQALKRAEERIKLANNKEQEVSVEEKEVTAVIHIQGNISSHSESILQEAYKDAIAMNKGKITLAFNENASINGAGIAILTQLLLDAQQKNFRIFVTGLSENFKKVFNIVGISKLVEEIVAD